MLDLADPAPGVHQPFRLANHRLVIGPERDEQMLSNSLGGLNKVPGIPGFNRERLFD